MAAFPLRTILFPTDFADRSNYAFRLACTLARDHGAQLVVMHVMEHTSNGDGDGILQRLTKVHPADGTIAFRHRLERGHPATEILRVAGLIQPDLIVMGTHGREGIGRLLLGSVAEQVIRHARCPVLTLKSSPHTPCAELGTPSVEADI